MFEVVHFTERSNQVFRRFVDTNFRDKFASTAFGPEYSTLEQKKEVCKQFYNKTGMVVNVEDVTSNPVLRSMAKCQLNALFGKFSQRTDKLHSVILSDYNTLSTYLFEKEGLIEITEITLFPNQDKVFLSYKLNNDRETSVLDYSNFIISSYVSALGRIKLHRMLSQIPGDNLLYSDTDCVIFEAPKGGTGPFELGSFLGQLNNECTSKYGAGSHVEQFCGLGPKSYTILYSVPKGDDHSITEVTRFKGIRRSRNNAELLSFSEMVKLLKGETKSVEIHVPFQIHRTRGESQVFNKPMIKNVRYNYDKRYLLPDYTSLPFGYYRVNEPPCKRLAGIKGGNLCSKCNDGEV
jgi:hypothetical protein